MPDYSLNIVSSALNSTSVFLFFTLAVSFWGRLILRACKTGPLPWGDPLTLIAGSSGLFFGGWLLHTYVSDYGIFLFCFLYAGALGMVLEILFLAGPRFLKENSKRLALRRLLISHQDLAGCLAAFLILAVFHSAVWESGLLEVWLYGSIDYLNWALLADYNLGLFTAGEFPLTWNFITMTWDSLGSQLLFGLYALAGGQTALFSISGFMLAMAVWIGLSLASLVRRVFGLGWVLSWLIVLGTIGGAFFSYLLAKGQVGQLAAMAGFAVLLREIYHWPGLPGRRETVRLFFGFFYLLAAYQSGYLAFSFITVLTMFLCFFVQDQKRPLIPRTLAALLRPGLIFLGLTSVSLILVPRLAWQFYIRTVQSIYQMPGWKISLASPWLLSGLPVYRPEYFTVLVEKSALVYLPFLGILLGMALWLGRRSSREAAFPGGGGAGREIEAGKIYCLGLTFSAAVMMYLAGYYLFDNRYQVWKFLSFAGLPLSVVPAGLFFGLVRSFKKPLLTFFTAVLTAVLSLIFGFGLGNLTNLTEMPKNYYGILPADSLFAAVGRLVQRQDPKNLLIFNFSEPSDQIFMSEIFKIRKNYRFTVINDSVYFKSKDIFTSILREDSAYTFISDREYEELYNSFQGQRSIGGIFVQDKNWIQEHGYADYSGLDRLRGWYIPRNWLTVRLILPDRYRSSPVRIKVSLRASGTGCAGPASMAVHGTGPYVRGPSGFPDVSAEAPASLTAQGWLAASVLLDPASSAGRDCRYFLEKVWLEEIPEEGPPADPAGDQGGGRPQPEPGEAAGELS